MQLLVLGGVQRSCEPVRTRLVANVIKSEIMHYHAVPILLLKLVCNVSRDVLVDLGEILRV